MVTGVLEGVGAAIGVAGLLASFKGAVDGYILIDTIFDKDNSLRDLILDYNIEKEKLKSWGDRFNVNAAREQDCLFYLEQQSVKDLMSEIFARIRYWHGEADAILLSHEAHDMRVNPRTLIAPGTNLNKLFQLDSPEVQAVSEAQMAKRHKKRAKLAIKNKPKFEEVVRKLRKLNDDLLDLLKEPAMDAFRKALPAYVLADPNNTL